MASCIADGARGDVDARMRWRAWEAVNPRGNGADETDARAIVARMQFTHVDDDGARCRLGGVDSIVEK